MKKKKLLLFLNSLIFPLGLISCSNVVQKETSNKEQITKDIKQKNGDSNIDSVISEKSNKNSNVSRQINNNNQIENNDNFEQITLDRSFFDYNKKILALDLSQIIKKYNDLETKKFNMFLKKKSQEKEAGSNEKNEILIISDIKLTEEILIDNFFILNNLKIQDFMKNLTIIIKDDKESVFFEKDLSNFKQFIKFSKIVTNDTGAKIKLLLPIAFNLEKFKNVQFTFRNINNIIDKVILKTDLEIEDFEFLGDELVFYLDLKNLKNENTYILEKIVFLDEDNLNKEYFFIENKSLIFNSFSEKLKISHQEFKNNSFSFYFNKDFFKKGEFIVVKLEKINSKNEKEIKFITKQIVSINEELKIEVDNSELNDFKIADIRKEYMPNKYISIWNNKGEKND